MRLQCNAQNRGLVVLQDRHGCITIYNVQWVKSFFLPLCQYNVSSHPVLLCNCCSLKLFSFPKQRQRQRQIYLQNTTKEHPRYFIRELHLASSMFTFSTIAPMLSSILAASTMSTFSTMTTISSSSPHLLIILYNFFAIKDQSSSDLFYFIKICRP